MDDTFAAGRDFLLRQGRLLERRLFDTRFADGPPARVADVVRGYQNDDGGFGHGLEPDTRCPASLPIYTEVALRALADGGAADQVMIARACDYLAGVAAAADAAGAVPLAFPVIESYPRAAHWTEWTYQPGLNPTAGLAGLLSQLGAGHPFVPAAVGYCWHQLESAELPDDAHALAEVLMFLEQVPDRDRADRHAAAVAGQLATASFFHADAGQEGYGLTPLNVAPAADSRWRGLFTAEQIDGHLDALLGGQQDDGGWPIAWEPPSEVARLEWRGIETLRALRTLTSYGRVRAAR